MEKISLKPQTTDIVLTSPQAKELAEVFSYDYSDGNGDSLTDAERMLGSLFLVGQIEPNTEDTSYVLSLIASLARREYYLRADILPQEALRRTLRKVNEALEDFFKGKDLKLNVGIFAIYGDTVSISKLGKFKMLRARDGDLSDVLNNVRDFEKDHAPQERFSNILSGRVVAGDKILAYYPSRSTIARERSLKSLLTELTGPEFADRVRMIREQKDTFSFAGIHLTLATHKERPSNRKVQPDELRGLDETTVTTPHETILVSAQAGSGSQPADTGSPKTDPGPDLKVKVPVKHSLEESSAVAVKPTTSVVLTPSAAPFIVPSEFSLTKRTNPLARGFSDVSRGLAYLLKPGSSQSTKRRAVALTSIVAVILAGAWTVKNFAISGSGNDAEAQLISMLREAVSSAQAKLIQNDSAAARQLLTAALAEAVLVEKNSDNPTLNSVVREALSGLDSLDQATDTSSTLFFEVLTQEPATLLGVEPNFTAIFTPGNDHGNLIIKKTEADQTILPISGFDPTLILHEKSFIILIDQRSGFARRVNLETLTVEDIGPINSGPITDTTLYEGNLYALTSNSIIRASDIGQGQTAPNPWLTAGSTLSPEPRSISVDGNLHLFDSSGLITTYFKGEKKSEISIPLKYADAHRLHSTKDSQHFYVINETLGRVYKIKKSTGAIEKVGKINNISPIKDSSMAGDESLYILTADNRVWKVGI